MALRHNNRLLCIGSGWIVSQLAAAASEWLGWDCTVAYQSFRNPTVTPKQLIPLPRRHEDVEKLIRDLEPHYIVFALGSAFVFDIEANLEKALEDNVVTLTHLCDAAVSSAIPMKKLLVVGSSSIYGPSMSALSEESPVAPIDKYGMVKAAQERIALSHYKRRGLPVIVARQFNTSGIGQSPRFLLPAIANQIAEAVHKNHQSLKLRIGDTSVKRDFLAISDTISAYFALLKNAAAGAAYNVCSGSAYAVEEIAMRACHRFGLEVEFDVQNDLLRKGEHRRPVLLGNNERLRSLGWHPTVSLDDLIYEMVEAELAAGG